MHSSVALKIVNREYNRVACNVVVPDVSPEDSYIIDDIAATYKNLGDDNGSKKQTKLEIFLEAISDGMVLQKAEPGEERRITTETGKEAVERLMDSMEELANKYHPDTLFKVDYALL